MNSFPFTQTNTCIRQPTGLPYIQMPPIVFSPPLSLQPIPTHSFPSPPHPIPQPPSWNRCGGRPVGLAKLGFWVWGLGFGISGLGFGISGLGFGVWGLGFEVWQKKRYARSNWGLGFGFGFGVVVWDLVFCF